MTKKILEKIFRTRGTYNYKLGRENAPLCHIVESTDLRFSPEELDKLLKEADGHSTDSSLFTPDTASTTENVSRAEAKKSSSENSSAAAPRKRSLPAIKISRKYTPHEFNDDPDLKEFRIKRMLEHINVCKGEYEKWILKRGKIVIARDFQFTGCLAYINDISSITVLQEHGGVFCQVNKCALLVLQYYMLL